MENEKKYNFNNRDETLQYHKDYYNNIYKQKIQEKRCFCEICGIEIAKWNLYKHNKSIAHMYKAMTDDERRLYDFEKEQKKENKLKIKEKRKLENKLLKLDNKIKQINEKLNVNI